MTEDEILSHIEKYRYFSFTKDDLLDTKKALENLRIFGLTEQHSSHSVRLTEDGSEAFKIGYNNWISKNKNFMDHELHEKILLFLYQFRDDDGFHDLLEYFSIKESILREKVEQLAKKNFVKQELSFRVLLSGEHRPEKKQVYRAKILIDGIEYVKKQLLINDETRKKTQNIYNITTGDIGDFQKNYGTVHGSMTSDSSQNKTTNTPVKAESSISKKIFIGVVVGLSVEIILYYLFGIK
jgi:hypothetical protein